MSNRNREKINTPQRVYVGFSKEVEDIIEGRVMSGKEKPKNQQTFTRITAAIVRHQAWARIKQDALTADLPPLREKKGAMSGLIAAVVGLSLIMILTFIFVTLAAVYSSGFQTITNSVVALPSIGNYNLSSYGETTFGNINTGIEQLKWISIGLMVGMIIGFLAGLYLIRLSPFWFAAYVLLSAIMVLFSIYISRTYETLYNTGGFLGGALQEFSAASYMIIWLPEIIAGIAAVGAIILMVNFPGKESGDGL